MSNKNLILFYYTDQTNTSKNLWLKEIIIVYTNIHFQFILKT